MPNRDTFPAIFAQLKGLFEPYAPHLMVKADEPDNVLLYAPASPERPDGLYFGAVQVRKNYVSYHLMPVYTFPDLLDGASEALKKRMQGKSCFNFTKLDEATVAALSRLTEAGFERYRQEQLV